jgi:5-methylcytosine-specific restriction protein A
MSRDYERFERNPNTWKRYNHEWRKVRAAYLASHPLCERCESEGRLTPATEVHHKLPLASGGTNAWENLAALCKPCHSAITIRSNA